MSSVPSRGALLLSLGLDILFFLLFRLCCVLLCVGVVGLGGKREGRKGKERRGGGIVESGANFQ